MYVVIEGLFGSAERNLHIIPRFTRLFHDSIKWVIENCEAITRDSIDKRGVCRISKNIVFRWIGGYTSIRIARNRKLFRAKSPGFSNSINSYTTSERNCHPPKFT